MISRTLVQLIEDNSDRITNRIVERQRADHALVEMGKLPMSELRDRAREVLINLGKWLVEGHEGETARRYEELGKRRCREGIPLHEVVRALHIQRENMIDFVREQGVGASTLQLYAEEELEHLVGLFYDRAVYHVVHGYETELRPAARAAL
jgi:hypothetical protein